MRNPFASSLERLSRLVDGRLDAKKAEQTRSRAEANPRDRLRLEVLEIMETAPKLPVPDGFRDRVMASLPPTRRSKQPVRARVDAILGDALIKVSNNDTGIPVLEGMTIRGGDRLRLDTGAMALLTLEDGSQVYLNSDAEVVFPTDTRQELQLEAGQLFAAMRRQHEKFIVRTPSATLGILGTEFDAKITGERSTRLQVLKGAVEFSNNAGKTIVRRRQQAEAPAHECPVAHRMQPQGDDAGAWRRPIENPNSKGNLSMKRIIIIASIGLVAWALWSAWARLSPRASTNNTETTGLVATESNPWTDDPSHWEFSTNMTKKMPTMFILRPTKFSDAESGMVCDYSGSTLRAIFKHCNIKEIAPLASPISIPRYRMELKGNLPSDYYDVMINMPNGREVLANELKSRFHVSLHVEKQEGEVYRCRRVNLNAPGIKPPSTAGGSSSTGRVQSTTIFMNFINTSFGDLCSRLSEHLGKDTLPPTGESDQTTYDFTLSWSPADIPESLIQSIRDQLGIELVPEKQMMDYLVVTCSNEPAPTSAPTSAPSATADGGGLSTDSNPWADDPKNFNGFSDGTMPAMFLIRPTRFKEDKTYAVAVLSPMPPQKDTIEALYYHYPLLSEWH
jgi:uncharacterized protein (TIGR03435 family)